MTNALCRLCQDASGKDALTTHIYVSQCTLHYRQRLRLIMQSLLTREVEFNGVTICRHRKDAICLAKKMQRSRMAAPNVKKNFVHNIVKCITKKYNFQF